SLALPLVVALTAPALGAARCANPQTPAALGIDLSQQAHCDPLVPERCLLPLPNDYYTVADGQSRTDRRVHFTPQALPQNPAGTPMDAVELNRNDGFSPGSAVLLWFPTADLVRSAAPSITDIDRSLERGSPIVVVDADSAKPWPVWAEPDLNSPP